MVSLYRSAVFLSHRRGDTAAQARSLTHDLLGNGFQVFLDVDNIHHGSSIRRTIDEAMGMTTLVLLLIGRGWLERSPYGHTNRLWDPEDWVRLEVESAEVQQVPVRPVLVDGAHVPDYRLVPQSLWPCLGMKALPLRHDDYVHDLEVLTSFADSVLLQRGLGDRTGRLGRRTFTRGDRVQLNSTEGSFSKSLTDADADVIWGRQVGTVLGVNKNFVLVRWDPQEWAPKLYGTSWSQLPMFGRPVMFKKTELSYFDAWISGKNLKPARADD